MEKISKEQLSELRFHSKRVGPQSSPVIVEINNLAVGEILLVKKEDWDLKTRLEIRVKQDSYIKRARLFGKRFTVKTLVDLSGWVVERIF